MSTGSLKKFVATAQTKKLFLAPSFLKFIFLTVIAGAKAPPETCFDLYLKAIASLEVTHLFSECRNWLIRP
jgi:hypothetical protein